jgi:predicted nucleotidyltransferase
MTIGVMVMSATVVDLSEDQLKRYRPFQRDKRPSLGSEARKTAARIAKGLGKLFGARKVILFGSLARGDQGERFDIDLAVKGISPERFFTAVAFATGQARKWKIDRVDVDDCAASLRDIIEKEGAVLWPAREASLHPEF